jgi:hypothetical protein
VCLEINKNCCRQKSNVVVARKMKTKNALNSLRNGVMWILDEVVVQLQTSIHSLRSRTYDLQALPNPYYGTTPTMFPGLADGWYPASPLLCVISCFLKIVQHSNISTDATLEVLEAT